MSVHDEVEALYTAAKARALLQAIEWAGSASELARRIGYTRFAGTMWLRRVDIPLKAALLLERLQGFPLKASDMRPDVYSSARKKRVRCPHCRLAIRLPGERTGCPPSFNRSTKRPCKKAAPKPKAAAGAKPKTKPATPKRKPA